MTFINLCWHFLNHHDVTVALLVLDSRCCSIEDFLDPAVFQYYEQGIYERHPDREIRFIVYLRKQAHHSLRRYVEMRPMLDHRRRDEPPLRPVEDLDLISLLDHAMATYSELFALNATDEEWASIAPEGTERPVIWSLSSDSLVRPAFLFRDHVTSLWLLVVRHPDASQDLVDRIIRENQHETSRCFPSCKVGIAEYIPGAAKPRTQRYRMTRLPDSWDTLQRLDWRPVTAEADIATLDGMLRRDLMFFDLATPAERESLEEDSPDQHSKANPKSQISGNS
jgi:hypothetical protein